MGFRTHFVVWIPTLIFAVACGDWVARCPPTCKCIWSNGKRSAECINSNFTSVPSTMSPELQVLNLNNNKLGSLPAEAFKSANISHLHRLFLRNCSIDVIDKDAFANLVVLIEVDISNNNIKRLHPDLFAECVKIREIRAANNPIETLEDGLFVNMRWLQWIDLTGCNIHTVGIHVFWNLPALIAVEFAGNQLSYLQLKPFDLMLRLKNLALKDNPWNCDCKLRPLWRLVVRRNLSSIPTTCKNPPHLKNALWNKIENPDLLACQPNVVSITQESNGVLACMVEGDPLPTVTWTFNNKLVTNNSDFIIQESCVGDYIKWSNLTLTKTERDIGVFKCIAKNYGGHDELLTEVKPDPYIDDDSYNGGSDIYDNWFLLVGGIIGALFLIVLVVFLKFFFCRKRPARGVVTKERERSATRVTVSEQKTLINVINPLQKPPRRADASGNSSEIEFHESSFSQYNDSGSVKGPVLLENKAQPSTSALCTLPRTRMEEIEEINDCCPPDLVTFPPKDSPVEGYVKDHSPCPRPQKLLNSPQCAGQFGTLPYSRSHSPFSPPLTVVPRQSGYVTIPRRPRAPNWNSSVSPVLVEPGEDLNIEPIYDNLGPRTTADGSSIRSLNKTLNESVNYRNRVLPQAPSDGRRYCEPIMENGSFYPVVKHSRTPNVRTTPTIDIPMHASTPEGKRQSWARNTPEGDHIHSAEEIQSLIAPTSINPRITRRIPPNPPPKPKKKPGKTFYEDEGEDGTEV